MELKEAIDLIYHTDLVKQNTPQVWADLGCGSGLFSKALSTLLPAGSEIHAIDKSTKSITQEVNDVAIRFKQLDFVTDELALDNLEGILMANSLHYVKDKRSFLAKARKSLKPEGAFVVVEYEQTASNPWVPYPLTLLAAQALFTEAGFRSMVKIGERPSVYQARKIYASLFR